MTGYLESLAAYAHGGDPPVGGGWPPALAPRARTPFEESWGRDADPESEAEAHTGPAGHPGPRVDDGDDDGSSVSLAPPPGKRSQSPAVSTAAAATRSPAADDALPSVPGGRHPANGRRAAPGDDTAGPTEPSQAPGRPDDPAPVPVDGARPLAPPPEMPARAPEAEASAPGRAPDPRIVPTPQQGNEPEPDPPVTEAGPDPAQTASGPAPTSGGVRVSIGRIEVNVLPQATPPPPVLAPMAALAAAPQRSAPAGTSGFDGYAARRRGLLK